MTTPLATLLFSTSFLTPTLWHAFLMGLAALGLAFTACWLVSLVKKDASIVDVLWGLAFVLAAWVYRHHGPQPANTRQVLLLVLVTVWGVRLAAYIFWRNHGKGEDYRYQKIRERWGASFPLASLVIVFLFQGLLVALIATPHLFVQAAAVSPGWRWSDFLGLLVWAIGFYFEAVGDWQMARFKADPNNEGKVMDRGLWGLTRHPNYFGDALVWWGFFLIALGAPGGFWTLPSALLMHFFLRKVTGVDHLEKTLKDRRPGYREYIETTPAFFPWPPWNKKDKKNQTRSRKAS